MALHDWTLVDAGIYHAFHLGWLGHLQAAINERLLPPDYYALTEQHAMSSAKQAARDVADLLTLHGPTHDELALLPPAMRRTLALRHVSGHRLAAVIEIVSPANKERRENVEAVASKIAALLDAGIHVLLVDLFPPGLHDPRRMHGAIGTWTADSIREELPPDLPLTLASYHADGVVAAYIETMAVGEPLPEMPLFLHSERYINVPLASTYDAAFRGMPVFWRKVLQGGAQQG